MKKFAVLCVMALAPLWAAASNSWVGYKQIQNKSNSTCLTVATFSSYDGGTYLTYENCNASDKKQHWTFSGGLLKNRNYNAYVDYYDSAASSYLFLSGTGRVWDFDQYGRFGSTNNRGEWKYVEYWFVTQTWPSARYDRSYLSPDTYRQNTTIDVAVPYLDGNGQVISGFDPKWDRVTSIDAEMNGGSINNGPVKATIYGPYDAQRYYAWVQQGEYVKAVNLQIVGNKVFALGAGFQQRTGFDPNGFIQMMPLALGPNQSGYGIETIKVNFAPMVSIKDLLKSDQAALMAKLNTPQFMQYLYSAPPAGGGATETRLDIVNYFWLPDVSLPVNVSGVPVGVKMYINPNSYEDTKWKGGAILQRYAEYVATYKGPQWTLSKYLGNGYISTQGTSLPESTSLTVLNVTGTMNGSWVGADTPVKTDYIGGDTFNLYIETNPHAKVVTVKVANGKLTATSAKYRNGKYDRYANDYSSVNVAQSDTDAGYGVKGVTVEMGTYMPTTYSMGDYASNQAELQAKLNDPNFERWFCTRPDIMKVFLYDGFWISGIDLANNRSDFAPGCQFKFITTAGFNTIWKNSVTLERGVWYTATYGANKQWTLAKGTATN